MKPFIPKESRSNADSNSTHKHHNGGTFNGKKDVDSKKVFSKQGPSNNIKSSQGNKYERPKGAPVDENKTRKQQNQPKSAGGSDPEGLFDGNDDTAKPAKIKKPKPPKPQLDPNENISQRAFIGGLSKDITSEDVEGRFKSFGQLKDVFLAKDIDGSCRGFGYVTLDTTRKEWLKCVALFNGAKWKGGVLKIEEANKDWQTKQKESDDLREKKEKKERDQLLKKIKRNPTRHSEDMSLINDKNMDGKRGWKRGRYGRPVITMKLGEMTYDPSHYKNNLEKLFNAPGKPLPLDKLIYEIDENEPLPKGKHLPTEVALAQFLSKSSHASLPSPISKLTNNEKNNLPSSGPPKTTSSDTKSRISQSLENERNSDDRSMMASILAGIDLSPRALSLDGSDIDDEDGYMEALPDTQADDLFGDFAMDSPEIHSISGGDSKPEDLFGDDDDEDEARANMPSLDFLEEDDGSDEEMASADEEDSEEGDIEDDEHEMDEDTIKAITQLQEESLKSTGGLFDSDNDEQDTKPNPNAKIAEESNTARLKAMEARNAELEASRDKQQQLIASRLANIDSKDKKEGHVVFSDSDDYDSEDYEKMEADHAKKLANMNKPPKSIFDSDSGSDDEDQVISKSKKKSGVKEMFESDDEGDEELRLGNLNESGLKIKEQFEGPGGKALFDMQTKIGTSDPRFRLTKDFLDKTIREEDDIDFVAHQEKLKAEELAASGAPDIIMDEDRQSESNISAEKMQAMNVLRAMFGDSVTKSKKKEEDTARKAKGGLGFTTGLTVRYDPDAAPPPPTTTTEAPTTTTITNETSKTDSDTDSNIRPESEVSEESEEESASAKSDDEAENEDDLLEKQSNEINDSKPVKKSVGFSFAFDTEELNEDDDSTVLKSNSNESAPVKKDLDTTPKFQVAPDLKSLFAPASGTFKLFGGDDDDDDDDDDASHDSAIEDDYQATNEGRSQEEILTAYSDGARTIFTSGAEALTRAPLSYSGSMFFFHFNNPELLKRSNYKTDNKVFMRTSTMDEITSNWEKTRHTMTQEFKRKHKSASRNKARATKRHKAYAGGGDQ